MKEVMQEMWKLKQLNIIISGGGTGGHVYPAISIANAFKNMQSSANILFIGAHDRMEMEKVPEAGYPIKGLWISGWQRGQFWANVLFPIKLFVSMLQALWHIIRFQPQVVIGVGGYSSGPVVWWASKLGVPTLIQEQNSYAGMTNRLLGRSVDKVCLAYESAKKYFPKTKAIITGNPVRQDILTKVTNKEQVYNHFGLQKSKKTALVIGGSLGARSINQAIKNHLSWLKKQKFQLLWQCGKQYYEEVIQAVHEKQVSNVKVVKFINRMDYAFAIADVVVSRAGAIAISEISALQKPAILVPSPNVAEDHQTLNAKALVEKKAAKWVKDEKADQVLLKMTKELLSNDKERQQLQNNIKQFARKEADKQIAQEALALIQYSNN